MSLAWSGRAAGGIPGRPLLAIGTLVLLAHLAVLQALPDATSTVVPITARAFMTRTVSLNPPGAKPLAEAKPVLTKPAGRPHRKSPPASPLPSPPPSPLRETRAVDSPALAPMASQPADASAAEATLASAMAEAHSPAASEAAASTAPVGSAASAAVGPTDAPTPPRETQADAALLSIPASARLKYDVVGQFKKMNYHAPAELLWRHDGANYEATLQVSAFLLGTFSQSSAGQITADGLAPARFSDKRRSEQAAHFDREKHRIVFSANTPEATLLAGAQDRVSVLFQLAAMLAGEPAKYPPATTITLPTVGPREAEVWLFTVEGEELLNLPNGPVNTVKLSRNPRREFDQRIEVWFAPTMGYLPVRFKITQANGDFVDQNLLRIEQP